MSEQTSNHPTAERIAELRKGIKNQIPRAERVLRRTDQNPPKRQIMNVAGDLFRQQEELKKEGEIDEMTGLLNRKGFMNALNREISRSKRTKGKIALILLDMNGLKTVNDELGHATGDERIKTAADILSASFRPTDIVARMGDKADEFLVAIPLENVSQLEERYSEINKTIRVANENWPDYPFLMPAGGTELDFNNIDSSIKRADEAMYIAKERSREIGQNVINIVATPVAV